MLNCGCGMGAADAGPPNEAIRKWRGLVKLTHAARPSLWP